METAWTFRIVLIMAFAVIIFGDFLGYGNAKKSDHPHTNDLVSAAATAGDHQQHHNAPLGIRVPGEFELDCNLCSRRLGILATSNSDIVWIEVSGSCCCLEFCAGGKYKSTS